MLQTPSVCVRGRTYTCVYTLAERHQTDLYSLLLDFLSTLQIIALGFYFFHALRV